MNGRWVLNSDGDHVWRPFPIENVETLVVALAHHVRGLQLQKELAKVSREMKEEKDEQSSCRK